jgi:hypothetical protein
MTKKTFIALADMIREHNARCSNSFVSDKFSKTQIEALADFCQSQSHKFMRGRWLAYIAGECGPNGG